MSNTIVPAPTATSQTPVGAVPQTAPTGQTHEYVTVGVPFGSSIMFQAKCSCGWLCGITHRAPRDAQGYALNSPAAVARGDFEQHYIAVVS